jgi:hypothetical protein
MIATVILLNWNGWKDTIECLESVLRLKQADFRVVVCDNASNDGSLEKIKEWAKGDLLAHCANQELSQFILPPVPKPVTFRELTREEAESGTSYFEGRLVLIQNGANLGFAGGCNVGLRYALSDISCQFFWLLNNDTVVEPEALSAMVLLMQRQPRLGLCGSLNVSYYNPKQVQAQGGKPYSRWTARVRTPPPYTVEHLEHGSSRMDFVNGASMLATRAFLEKVGLMEESYFLYFEEMDWAMRARGKFLLGYSVDSVIYHKEGATIGSNPNRKMRSLLSDQYLSRNRVLFTKRFFPWALPTVMSAVCFAAAYRLCQGDIKRAKAMLVFMLRGLISDA